jgi:hypothetical protein
MCQPKCLLTAAKRAASVMEQNHVRNAQGLTIKINP